MFVFQDSMMREKVPGHLKWNGTRMGLLAAIELGSAEKMSLSAVPNVQGGSGDTTAWECFRHTLKKRRHGRPMRHRLRELLKEWTFSSKTPAGCTGAGQNNESSPTRSRAPLGQAGHGAMLLLSRRGRCWRKIYISQPTKKKSSPANRKLKSKNSKKETSDEEVAKS